jgi:tetratricopeptide (TPR) repeat protein
MRASATAAVHSLRLPRRGRPARTLGYRATNRKGLSDDLGANVDFEDALALALAAGQTRHAATIYNNWANVRARIVGGRRGQEEALATLNAGIALCRSRGLTGRVNFMYPSTAGRLWALGELDEVLAVATATAERAEREGDQYNLARAYHMAALVLLLRGQADRLAEVPDQLETAVGETPLDGIKAYLLTPAARIRAALGQREQAVAILTRLADNGGWSPQLVETAISLDELDLAERLAARVSHGQVFCEAALAEARGDLETARHRYAQEVDDKRGSGEVVELAKALVGLGRVLARLGRTAEASEALNEARPTLVELQAAPLLAETDALLEQLTALSA